MYKSVAELTRAELDELKEDYFWTEDTIFRGAWEVPDEVILNHYEGVSFVDEDFMCNLVADGEVF